MIIDCDSTSQSANSSSTISRRVKRPSESSKSNIVNALKTSNKNPQTEEFNMNFSTVFYTPGCGSFTCMPSTSSKMPKIEKPSFSKMADDTENVIIVYDGKEKFKT